ITMTGGDDPEVPQATTSAPEASAPVVAEATPVPPVAEPVPAATPEPTQELPAFLRPQPVAEPEAVAVEEPAPEVVAVEEPAPEVVAEPIVPTPAETAAPEVAVETPAPEVRPEARPESVEVAVVPEPTPLPEPVETPRPVISEPAAEAAFPDQSGNRPLADNDTAAVTLPATPDVVEAVGAGLEVDIPAVVPGNEILPEVDSVMATWTVQLPFVAAGARSNIIAVAGPVSPVWVQPGLVITGVNGVPVDAISDIPDALRAQTAGPELSPTVQVNFQTRNPASGEVAEHGWILPVVQQVELLDGSRFETVYVGGDWKTTVAELAEGQDGGLQLGDVISSYIPTSESVDGPDTLMKILDREIENGTEQFMFAVQREGSLWVASLAYKGAEE
ncbi:MAG: serine/threonine protein kinase, partial [Paracoccaceae bacterium]|nr:serine/threonine protein kinase [Paracoccaceae bacterium]